VAATAVWVPVSQHCAVAASRKRDAKPALIVVIAWRDAVKNATAVQTEIPSSIYTMGTWA
jgi:hypothetical protein